MTPKSTREEPIAAGRELAEPPSKDPRLAVLMADRGLGRQPDYGVVTFGERFPAADRDPLDTGVAHSRDARKLLEVASAVLGEAAADGFDKLSNPVFRPAELRHDKLLGAADAARIGNRLRRRVRSRRPPDVRLD